jgi:GT2 family glycosyltransferase
LYKEHGNDIKVINEAIGGLFMLFSKRTWEKVGGFPEGGIQINGHFFDYHFCKQIMKHRLRIGIAKGIYLFHYYRFESGQDTRRSISHLL